ncbi:hypothetical protein MaudCBS49596_000242 [Microsporum audouinii]
MSVPASSLGHIDSAALLFGLDYLLGRSDCIWETPNDVPPISLSQDIDSLIDLPLQPVDIREWVIVE